MLARKSFRRNLQYRVAHLISTFGSAIFGFIMIAIWRGAAGPAGGLQEYSVQDLVLWVAFGQTLFNLIQTDTGLNIQLAVRSGNVSIELMRPVGYFQYVISREAGQQLYRFLYRCIPIYLLYSLTVGYRLPSLKASLLLLPSLLLALYIGLCINYLVGISSFWTTDIRWAHGLHFTFVSAVSGLQIPSDLLPGFIGRVAPYLPWASLVHYPNRIYLGFEGVSALIVPAFWAFILTLLCRLLTHTAKRKLEVQGG